MTTSRERKGPLVLSSMEEVQRKAEAASRLWSGEEVIIVVDSWYLVVGKYEQGHRWREKFAIVEIA